MTYRRAIFSLIIVGAALRCLIAANIEFGNDEVYYWTYSQHLQWNYFDHPPMVALLIRLTTLNLSLERFELFVRLGSIICAGFATWFLYKTVSNLHSERAGFIAALLYNASFYGSIISGVFILPDSPQMFFWTGSLFVLSRLLMSERPAMSQWILFGIMTGFTIMSKVHGIFIWAGLVLYVLFYRRKWLSLWQPYLSALVAFLISLPIFVWNFQNNFITYRYHSSRVAGIHFKADNFYREIFGQLFYNNPFNVVLLIMASYWFWKKAAPSKNDFPRVSFLIAVPMILVLLCLAMFNDTLPHWSGPAYITLIPVTAIYLSETKPARFVPNVVKASLAFTLLIAAAGTLAIRFYPGTLGKKGKATAYGEGDVTLDMYGWDQAARKIDSLIAVDNASGRMSNDAEFVSTEWFPAAHLDYYIARPLHKFVIGIGEMDALHHFEWLNEYRLKNRSLTDAYCIFPSNYSCDVKAKFGNKFKYVEAAGSFPIFRGNKTCKYIFVYRLKEFTGTIPKLR